MPENTAAGPVTPDPEFLRSVDGITDLQGQDYINHRGLLALGHLHGLSEVVVTLLDFSPESGHAIVSATAKGDRGSFTDIADASPENVGPRTVGATPRMASTRAINRSLRLYLGIGATTAEEIGPETPQRGRGAPARPARPAAAPTHDPRRTQGRPPDNGAAARCPSCGSGLWDNREDRANGSRRPAWKCQNQQCDGYRGEPWIQWDAEPFPGGETEDFEPPAHAQPAMSTQAETYDDDVPF